MVYFAINSNANYTKIMQRNSKWHCEIVKIKTTYLSTVKIGSNLKVYVPVYCTLKVLFVQVE